MSFSFPPRPIGAKLAPPLVAAALLAGLAGCDNPTCVFTTGCQDGGSGPGGPQGRPAARPVDGQWILNARPSVVEVFPRGTTVHPDAPIVLVFSESMKEDTLDDTFEVVRNLGVFQDRVAIDRQLLLARGRVLVLFPTQPLMAGQHFVQVAEGTSDGPFGPPAEPVDLPTDLTGQELTQAGGVRLGQAFTVSGTPPVQPTVVAAWPLQSETAASALTEVLVVFDRAMAPTTFTDDTFKVEVVGGSDPSPDPPAEPVTDSDDRVFRWQSADPDGAITPLPTDATVRLTLSNTTGMSSPGPWLEDTEGNRLERLQRTFDVAPFREPDTASLLSQPEDAIGIRNLRKDGVEDLTVDVQLFDAQAGDVLVLTLVGLSKNEEDPQLIAQRRELVLSGAAPIVSATYELDDVDLAVNADPTRARFADGEVTFAFRVRRGSFVSPLHVLDVDLVAGGIQDPLLDTQAPTVLTLDFSGGTTGSTASDLSDLVIAGTADSVLRSVEVEAVDGPMLYSNGTLPPVVGTRLDPRAVAFVASPFGFGVLQSASASYTVTAYDDAFNASPPVTGTYHQRGAVGSTPFTPGDAVTVEVFDAETLAVLAGAQVSVHTDAGDDVTYPLFDSGSTAADGRYVATTDAAGAGAIVTVELPGYDLFTFHGLTSSFVSVPLEPTGTIPARVSGQVTTSDSLVDLLLSGLDRRLDDSRRPHGRRPGGYATEPCKVGPLSCSYGPEDVRPGRRGVQSFVAGKFLLTDLSFNVDQLLQAFCLETPLPRTAMGALDDTSFSLPFLLFDDEVDETERPEELDTLELRGDLVAGIDTTRLADDPATTGVPFVSVEANVFGVPGTVTVGMGLAVLESGARWKIRSARPGAATPAGFFGTGGTLDTDAFVRMELRDLDGNVAGVRPRLSDIPSLPVPVMAGPFGRLPEVSPPDVPQLVEPASGGVTGGRAFTLRFADTLVNAPGFAGLHRVRLEDTTGRGWVLWRPDPLGTGGDVRLRVPDLTAMPLPGGVGLADGTLTCEVASFSWEGLDPGAFLWTDVEREQGLYAIAEPLSFTQTP